MVDPKAHSVRLSSGMLCNEDIANLRNPQDVCTEFVNEINMIQARDKSG